MKSKALNLLGQLNDTELFNFLSDGMYHIYLNAIQMELDSHLLQEQGRVRGARILRLFAEEEAAKFLILMDLVRCKRSSTEFSRQFDHFYDHLAKKIYIWVCLSKQWHFQRAVETISLFRNESFMHPGTGEILPEGEQLPDEREGAIYIDCFEEDGELNWLTPTRIDEVYQATQFPESKVLFLAHSLYSAGFTSPKSLALISARWRGIEMNVDFNRSDLIRAIDDTVTDLREAKVLSAEADQYISAISQLWFFPLQSLDLRRPKRADKSPATLRL